MQEAPTPAPTPLQTVPTNALATDDAKFETLRSYFIGAIAVAIVIFVVWGGFTLVAEISQRQLNREYLLATDDAARAAFIKNHRNHPLGGMMLLAQAHEYYNQGNYAAAKDAYTEVLSSGLKHQPILLEQAQLGLAFTNHALNEKEGLAALKILAMNPQLTQGTRAYAATELAGYWAKNGDIKQAKEYLQLSKTFKDARPWQQQTLMLEEIYPALSENK